MAGGMVGGGCVVREALESVRDRGLRGRVRRGVEGGRVKIKLVHDECGREVLVGQILDSQGHCPWDGKPFNKDYTAVLTEALEAAENAGGLLENALETIAD